MNRDLIAEVKELEINLPAFLELKLIEHLALVKNGLGQENEWVRRDSNPRPPPREGGVITPRPRTLLIVA